MADVEQFASGVPQADDITVLAFDVGRPGQRGGRVTCPGTSLIS
jgi:hypothetical protein